MVLSYYLQYRLQITHKNPNLNKQLIFIFILQKKKEKRIYPTYRQILYICD